MSFFKSVMAKKKLRTTDLGNTLFYMSMKIGSSHSGENFCLSLFENGLLRTAFGPKRIDITGDWIKLHNEKHHDIVLFTVYF